MPQVIVTQRAASGLARCRQFLMNKNPLAALKAGQVLEKQFEQLEKTPEIGRPFVEAPQLRELLIDFGDSGYVALYRYEQHEDRIYILAFRHQKEAGY